MAEKKNIAWFAARAAAGDLSDVTMTTDEWDAFKQECIDHANKHGLPIKQRETWADDSPMAITLRRPGVVAVVDPGIAVLVSS